MIEIKKEEDLAQWLQQNQNLLANKIVRLRGSMGAGKTTLVRLYLALISKDQEVSSPTFALHHRYQTQIGPVDHMDLFRLKNPDELEEAGFWDILDQAKTLFIEWPERVPDALWPKHLQYVDLCLEMRGSSRFLLRLSL